MCLSVMLIFYFDSVRGYLPTGTLGMVKWDYERQNIIIQVKDVV